MNDLQILRPRQLCQLLSISIATLYRWEAEGKLPFEKIRMGPNTVGFLKSDVEVWLKSENAKSLIKSEKEES